MLDFADIVGIMIFLGGLLILLGAVFTKAPGEKEE